MMIKHFMIATAIASLVGCSAKTAQEAHHEQVEKKNEQVAQLIDNNISEIPTWYMQVPEGNEKGFYGTGTGLSSSIYSARNKAWSRATGNIANAYKTEVAKLNKDYVSSTTSNITDGDLTQEDSETTINAFSNENLGHLRIVDYKILREGTQYRVYLLAYGSHQEFDPNELLHNVRQNSANAHVELMDRVDKNTAKE
ncbi:hypothetical protein L0B53_19195 (plasmid) [Vibrio sp. SS-MA-C1-2]|uniref:hypothetical protein n=1 Tax=Vibrio sp. SS-MA-C1-2 TaxID=2908646 RepID=UPI001F246564|nr:hypothetical protein [Vibrio sp. SS-MA-C1-2]UJF20261.1 hypothetical protein L0B53_19195 [Vibrio sp. SS-MA-C1-2]